jgi:hypothetical protein
MDETTDHDQENVREVGELGSAGAKRPRPLALFISGGIFLLTVAAFPALVIAIGGSPLFRPPSLLGAIPIAYWFVVAVSLTAFLLLIIWTKPSGRTGDTDEEK